MSKNSFRVDGSASVGWIHARGLAQLTATPETLNLSIILLGEYQFTPGNVVAITRYAIFPWWGMGIRIQHTVADYPERILFLSWRGPAKLLAGIHDAGFEGKAPLISMPIRKGLPIRWQAIFGIALLATGCAYLGSLDSQFAPPLKIAPAFLFVVAVLRSVFLQRLILRPGRSIGELKPLLNLLCFVFGILALVFLIVSFCGAWKHEGGAWIAR